QSTLVSIACYAFPAETLPKLTTYLEDGENPDEPGWFLQWLQERGPVNAYTFDGAWFDIGTADSYLDAVEYALDGGTLVADDATVENSDLGDVVHVMSGATVTDSTLDRAVVFEDATITDSKISKSVIDEGVTLENVDLTGALIGSYTSITEGDDF
ncbi:sugar phosphate nucleotidyltransferase, partial [Haloarcula sp. AONF1]